MPTETCSASDYANELSQFIRAPDFPCVGAKAALAQDQVSCAAYHDIESAADDVTLRSDLQAFIRLLRPAGPGVQSFAAIFANPQALTEKGFEKALWNRLQSLHNLDAVIGEVWNKSAASDPDSPHFSLSLCGEAFFVIGLHPNASRPARRFRMPTLVFNSHLQFERLREDGRFTAMQKIIRKRELEISGSLNPMLNDFGDGSEARQYSGRQVGEAWTCPFKVQEAK